ncbi:MAG: prepilin-type N-terminal cleavage/methylation domain-containing protein [Phycisphaerales bacterium]|nr:prepilin-type N-terminal cleavage/methylation domain-containing protein [Phycisphaerales bacterium]
MSIPKHITRRAFTLVELLVVIAVIAILVSLTLAAGSKVVSVGRERGTQWTLQTLDSMMSDYIQANGSIPSPTVRDPVNTSRQVAIADGGVGDTPTNLEPFDSTAWLVYQLQSQGAAAVSVLDQLDDKVRKVGFSNNPIAAASVTGTRTTRILDVWGRPIRYVHPRFGGVRGEGANKVDKFSEILGVDTSSPNPQNDLLFSALSRDPKNKKDADGGAPVARRPYFYSAGADGDPSTIDDNVYLVRPNFPRP